MAWQAEFRAGVWLPQIEWWLDAHFPVERAFVSHAHSDHIAPHGEILCSAGTSRLMKARMPGKRVEHVLPFEHAEQLTQDCGVTLFPAGHIYGSAQILLDHAAHGRLLYTGDFKLRRGRSAEPCATPRADVLIMETTFGRPHYVFPPTEQVLRDIAAFCHMCLDDGETPVLFGYSLGKSQELLCGLAEARLPVMLHPQTMRLTRIYEELGIAFPPYREFRDADLPGHVVICPPMSNNAAFLRPIAKKRTAVVTGWAMDPGAKYRYQCDAAFPLSDHADFPDLLRFVEAVQPQRVLTLHGFAQEFALTLRDRGIEAWAIGEDNQLEFSMVGTPPRSVRSAAESGRLGAPPLPSNPDCEPGEANCFARFAIVAEQVKATPKKLEKIELLRAYLAELSADDAAHAALFFTARPFPQSDNRVLTMGWSIIKRAVLEAAGMTETDYRAAYHRFADAGDAAEALLQNRPSAHPAPPHAPTDAPTAAPTDARHPSSAFAAEPSAQSNLLGYSLPPPPPPTPEDSNLLGYYADAIHSESPDNSNLLGYSLPSGSEAAECESNLIGDSDNTCGPPRERRDRADLHAPVRSPAPGHAAPRTSALGSSSTAAYGGETSSFAGVSLAAVASFFSDVAAARGPAAKLELLQATLARLSAQEAKYLVKIITSDLRIGLKEGLVEEAIAAAAGQPLELVREANMLSGDIAAATRAARNNRLDTIQLRVFHPLQFMLASPEPTAEAILERLSPPVWLEEKYDGIRCQLHKQGARVELYSRDLKRITAQFPDLARAAEGLPGDCILDGELLAWREGRALPFAELQKRLGRKGDDFFLGAEIPVSISVYDLLWLDGRALLKEPLAKRRELLERVLRPRSAATGPAPATGPLRVERDERDSSPAAGGPTFVLAPIQQASTATEIEAAFLAARQRGNEGLMAKDPNSIYTPGRRGLAWLKLKKAYATLDVVVVGVEYGHGKRRDVLSDYTFAIRDEEHDNRLLTVGKAYSGLTDAEIAQLTEHFLANTIEAHGRYRAVVPDVILEIAFDIIQPSSRHQSGYALRFPRIARIRKDKTLAEIDTLETCRRLANASFADASVPRAAAS